MAGQTATERRLEELAALADTEADEEASKLLLTALLRWNSTLSARAAGVVVERGWDHMTSSLMQSFDRFVHKPAKTDPGCRAKCAIIAALNQFDCDDPAPFLAGVRHVQLEPVYGGKEDTAAELRGQCAAGLFRLGCRLACIP